MNQAVGVLSGKKSYFNAFLVLWAGQLVATLGHGISSFAIGVYVFQLTQQATGVSLVTLFAFVPAILLAPFAGVLADRYDRRLLMILGDGISALGLVVILVLYQFHLLEFWHILVCVGFSSIFQSLLDPCYRATVTDLVSENDYSKASGLVQLASSAQYLLSPFLAGLVMYWFDLRLALMIDILTIIVTVVCTNVARRAVKQSKPSGEGDFMQNLRQGWRFVLDHPGIYHLMILVSLVTFSMGFLVVLFQPLILAVADPKTLGSIQSIAGIGMLVSSVLLGVRELSRYLVQTLSLGLAIGGVLIIGLGISTNLIWFSGIAFVYFASLPIVNASVEVLMRRSIPNETQGRVWGLVGVISQLGYVAAYAISGPLADKVFIPLLRPNGALATSILGQIFGIGPSRGIGLMFALAGLAIFITAMVIPKIQSINQLEKNLTAQKGIK